MIATVIQSTVLPHFQIWGVKAELVLALAAAWALLRGLEEGLQWAIIAGVAMDLFSAAPFGTMTVALTVTTYLVGQVGPTLLRANVFLPIAITPAATVTFNAVATAILEGFGWQVYWDRLFVETILPLVLLDTIIMIPIYLLLYQAHAQQQWEIDW